MAAGDGEATAVVFAGVAAGFAAAGAAFMAVAVVFTAAVTAKHVHGIG
jgi:hypothetical protein